MEQELFLVKTSAGSAYCIGTSADDAWNKFKNWMDKENYGFSTQRQLVSIERVATTYYFDSKLSSCCRSAYKLFI